MSLLWGRAHIMTDLVSLVQAEEGLEGVSPTECLHQCLRRGTCLVSMPCCRGGYPCRGDSWGPRGRMQGDGRPHFMGHRGGFQGMPQPQPHPGGTL